MDSAEISAGMAMAALSSQQEMLAHNLANLNSTAFKRKIGKFEEYLSGMSGASGEPLAIPAFVEQTDHSQGDISPTHNELDVAIHGKGFFRVETPGGARYTRVGSLFPNGRGELCTSSGYPILGLNDQPILVALGEGRGTQVVIDPVGSVRTPDGMSLGEIRLYAFEDPQRLESLGDGLYQAPSDMRPVEDRESRLEQGSLERTNVDATAEFVTMLVTRRSFEAAGRALTQVQKAREAFLSAARQ